MSKRPSFMQRFGRQHVDESQKKLRSARSQFHSILPLISDGGSRKRFVLVRSDLIGQFLNILTGDYKYSRWNRENLSQQVPIPKFRKRKTCSPFFIAFLKYTLNLEYFGKKKDQSHSLSITEIINCKTGNYLNVQKAIFHGTLRKKTC